MISPDLEKNQPLILVVDDEKTVRIVLRRAMEKQGYRVAEAANGEQCLEFCQQFKPALVLLDAIMPQMDGFTCCNQLTTILSDDCPAVLIITTLNDQASVDRAFEVGATDYATKPIDWPVLLMRVQRLIQTRWAMTQLRQRSTELMTANAALQTEITHRMQAEKQLKLSLQGKEVLLKEIHHRVKSNLQVIGSLLRLQSRYTKDQQVLSMFRESQNRIKAMALVHEKLYQSQDLVRINFPEYISSLVASLLRSYGMNSANVNSQIDIDDISLEVDTAISCGLIINELVANSLKHAFPESREGEIRICLQAASDQEFVLSVSDNGVGFPKDLDFQDTESLGLQLVCSLAEQLGANIELRSHQGTEFKIAYKTR